MEISNIHQNKYKRGITMKDWKITGFKHSGITVKNLEVALDFYVETLGLELVSKQINDQPYIHDIVNLPGIEKIKIAFVKTPDGQILELLEYVGTEVYSGEARSCDYGTGHICLTVTNLESMYQELLNKGIKFKSEKIATITKGIHEGSKAVYMKDPDGYLIEMMEVHRN